MSLKEIKEKVEASSELANTRESVTTDLSLDDQLKKLFDPDWTKEDWEWITGMAQAMAYCKNPKASNSQRRNVWKKKTKTEAEPKDHKHC